MLLRGGAEQFLEETERSLHDAIMIVRRTIKNDAVVAGMVPLPKRKNIANLLKQSFLLINMY